MRYSDGGRSAASPVSNLAHDEIVCPFEVEQAETHVQRYADESQVPPGPGYLVTILYPLLPEGYEQRWVNDASDENPRGVE